MKNKLKNFSFIFFLLVGGSSLVGNTAIFSSAETTKQVIPPDKVQTFLMGTIRTYTAYGAMIGLVLALLTSILLDGIEFFAQNQTEKKYFTHFLKAVKYGLSKIPSRFFLGEWNYPLIRFGSSLIFLIVMPIIGAVVGDRKAKRILKANGLTIKWT